MTAEEVEGPLAGRLIEWVALERLELDPLNPRLAASADADDVSQRELVRRLWQVEAAEEVALSIAQNGFYPQEPLIVIPGSEPGKLVVVEGNRRLAATLLLVDDQLRKSIKATDLPDITAERRLGLQSLPVLRYDARRDVWAYLGFRHINGTRPWDAYSKAKFVADVHESLQVPLDEIARRIGDRNTTVVRLYRGLKVLRQAEEQLGYDREDRFKRRFSFSHLYTALDQAEFQRFLGITPRTWTDRYPVPRAKLEELGLLLLWLYGRSSTETPPIVRTQNPDLNVLRETISSTRGVSLLRSGRALSSAYEASLGTERRFRDALNQASEELVTAKGTVVGGFAGQRDLIETAELIRSQIVSILADMESSKPERPARR